MTFPSENQARDFDFIEDVYSQSDRYHVLNGQWKFNWVDKPASRPTDFFRVDFDASMWKSIPVPGNWEVNGYGTPIYVNHPFEFAKKPPYIHHDYNPVGSYRHHFLLPKDWAGDEVFIHFGAVKSAFYLWINGQRVGYSQGSKLPAEFNVTDFLKPGENLLAVEVYRWSDGSYLEAQGFWRISGIERDVYLVARPKTHVRDFFVKAQQQTLELTVNLANYQNPIQLGPALKLQLFDGDNKLLLERPFSFSSVGNPLTRHSIVAAPAETDGFYGAIHYPSGATDLLNIKLDTLKVKPWSAEVPNLYRLVLSLYDDQGQHLGV